VYKTNGLILCNDVDFSGKCLYLSGLIPEPMNACDDYRLKEVGIGFTNFVSRCSKGSVELTRFTLLFNLSVYFLVHLLVIMKFVLNRFILLYKNYLL